MSVPSYFSSEEDYVEEVLIFFKKYQWIYNFNNVNVLVKNIINNIPMDWNVYFKSISLEELHNLVLGIESESMPSSLKLFLRILNRLKPIVPFYNDVPKNSFLHNCGLSPKKMHEILSLGCIVNTICKDHNCDLVVDIGSGLGYLSHLLFIKYGYSVLGLEAKKDFIELAYKNQHKFYPQAEGSVIFCELYVSENSVADIQNLVTMNFSSKKKICIVGLHACADLSITVLKIFIKFELSRALAIMPCCYHRIEVKEEFSNKIYFKNFPYSSLLQRLMKVHDAYSFIQKPYLRLASQQTSESFIKMSENDHKSHSAQFMYRCILQQVAEQEHCVVHRLKRKSDKLNLLDTDKGFQEYIDKLKNTYKLDSSIPNHVRINDKEFLMKMMNQWEKLKDKCYILEALTGLQFALQILCENMVLVDRVQFLKENGYDCYVKRITNNVISPRCHVLIAIK